MLKRADHLTKTTGKTGHALVCGLVFGAMACPGGEPGEGAFRILSGDEIEGDWSEYRERFEAHWESRNSVEREIRYLRSDRAIERASGALRLGGFPSRGGDRRMDITPAADDLIRLLSDDAEVRDADITPLSGSVAPRTVATYAACALARMRPPPCEKLVAALKAARGNFAIAMTATAVGKARCEQARPDLIELLDHEHGEVRVRAAVALRQIDPEHSATPLLGQIRLEEAVLDRLLHSLGDLDIDLATAEIVRILRDDDDDLRLQAMEGARLIACSKVPDRFQAEVAPVLADLVRLGKTQTVRTCAARVLGYLSANDGVALGALLHGLRNDADGAVRRQCASSLFVPPAARRARRAGECPARCALRQRLAGAKQRHPKRRTHDLPE